MMSGVSPKSLKAWGIRHRLSSAYNPHSNCRAELAVKVGKKLLRDNMGHGGSLDTDKIMRAVLQYLNTRMQDCRRSPAQMVFGRHMRDFIPSLTYKYEPAKDWAVSQEHIPGVFLE
jgi:malate/lactate dehydrogenase